MIFLYYILAVLLIWLSYKSFRGGLEYLRYFRRQLAQPTSDYTPFATVFAPCKGVDQGMLENLDALLSQDYPEYEVVFIVDEETDGSASLIESAWREARRQVKLVVAPPATDSSQKITNLIEGINYADEHSEVFVFVDSDARPSEGWLRSLVSPLSDEGVGASTGYRWFISKHETLASEIRNMWNASIASALGPNRDSNFCWGGSTALTRATFERLDIAGKWRGALSDDFTVTHAIHEAGLDIFFVPRALTPSVEDCTFHELVGFTTRQMKITRVYAPKLWIMSLVGSALFNVVMITSLLIVMFSSRNDSNVAAALFTMLCVTIFSIGKSWLRMRAVMLALGSFEAKLRRQMLPQLTFWAITPALFLYNSIAALLSRRMTWRGITYEMLSPRETLVHHREPPEKVL